MTRAYYNEINPHAAQWLRNLIGMGMIAPGDVDERDIRDIIPSDLAGYTQCHFFAGIGVWSYALRMAGWPDDRPVWTGSPPCQPFSAAGRGGGVADERHLWPHLHHLIRVQRPPVFFGEQVASKDGLGWLDLVQADMEAEDYSGGAFDLCAAGVGAPHIRQRLSLVFRDARIAWATLDHTSASRFDDAGERFEGTIDRNGSIGRGGLELGRRGSGLAPGYSDALSLGDADGARAALGLSEPTQWEEGLAEVHDDGGHRLFRSGAGRPGDGSLDGTLGERREGERLLQERGDENPQVAGIGEAVQLADGLRDGAGPAAGNGDGPEATSLGIDGSSPGSGTSFGIGGASCDLADLIGERRERGADSGRSDEEGPPERLKGSPDLECNSINGELANVEVGGRVCGTGLCDQGSQGRGDFPANCCCDDVQPGRPGPVNSGWSNADWLFCRDGKWRPVESGTFPLVDGSAFRMDSGSPFAGKSRGKMLEGAGNAIVSEQQAHVVAAYLEHEADEIAAFHAERSGLHLIGDLL